MDYEAVIGLEVHVQVRTQSKMFCACANRFGQEPNTQVCPVCLGYPGTLPVMNREAVRRTLAAGMMCGCAIPTYSKFDRKSYYYPDMPKNFQISQFDLPLCGRGEIPVGGEGVKGFSGEPLPAKIIGITRIHLEEDVGKLTHLGSTSAVDYNRAGVPLMEIVSEPDMRTPDEAYAYLTALKQILQFADISDCDMEKGQMRCDVNVSVRPVGQAEFGTKIEIKNLNSFRSVHRSLVYEIFRQTDEVSNGIRQRQETRRWDDVAAETSVMRVKEHAHDYRYFPEPDLMPVSISDELKAEIRATLPEIPARRQERFVIQYAVTAYDAHVLTQEKALADYFEAAVAATAGHTGKPVANWIITELLRELGERHLEITTCPIPAAALAKLVDLVTGKVISGKAAKDVLAEMFTSGKAPEQIVQEKGLQQDNSGIDAFVDQAIAANPAIVEQFRSGKTKALQALVGQVLKASRGKADPQAVSELLQRKLS